MEIFGWMMMILLMAFGLTVLIIFVIPFIISEIKTMQYKIKKAIEDKKFDVDKRSEERKKRDEVKRQKDFEFANKKLETKLHKVNKQIELQEKKLELAKQLKEQTNTEMKGLAKPAEPKNEVVVNKQVDEPVVINKQTHEPIINSQVNELVEKPLEEK